MVVTLHSWRTKDQRTGRWRLLRFKLSEKDAKEWAEKEHIPLEMVPNTAERRVGSEGHSIN